MAKKKKQTVGYKYFASGHFILCHGPIDAITKISFQEKDAYLNEESENKTIYIDKPNLFGGTDQQGGVQGNIQLLFGQHDQQKSTKLGQILSKITNQFNGLYSAWRGVCSVVFDNVYIGTAPNMPDSRWRVKRIHTRHDGQQQWYDEKAEIDWKDRDGLNVSKEADGFFKYSYQDGFTSTTELTGYAQIDYSDGGWQVAQGPFGSLASNNTHVDAVIGRAIMIREKITLDSSNTILGITVSHDDSAAIYVNGNLIASPSSSGTTTISVGREALKVGDNLIFVACINTLPIEIGLSLQYSVSVIHALNADINPAHIIRECLTNKIWGVGVAESSIDDVSFRAAADILYDEKMGMSIKWSDSTTIDEFISEVKNHINAQLYLDRLTNKWKLYLIRDNYNVDDLVHVNEDVLNDFDFERKTLAECTNTVTVTYWDRERAKNSTLTVQDIGRIAQQGGIIAESVEYIGFTNSDLAGRIALRDLKSLSATLASVSFDISESIADTWHLGMPFKISYSDYGLQNAVMRVTKISSGDGLKNSLHIEAREDVFSSPMQSVVEYVPPVAAPSGEALDAEAIVFEVPYIELVEQYGQDEVNAKLNLHNDIGCAGMAAIRPNSQHINGSLYIDSGAGYDERTTLDFCPSATLKDAIGYMDSSFELENVSEFDLLEANHRIQINDEIMAFVSFDNVTNIITVKRGCFDTVPQNHLIGSMIFGWDNYSGIDDIEHIEGETVDLKLLTQTSVDQLAINEATTHSLTFNARAFRPYPPANVLLNDELWPSQITGALELTWSHRNRLQQTGGEPLSWFDSGIAIEGGVEYVLELYDADDVLISTTNLGAVDSTIVDYSAVTTAACKIRLYSVRDDIKSLEAFEHTVIVSHAAPYNLVGTWNETTQSVNLTWEFD